MHSTHKGRKHLFSAFFVVKEYFCTHVWSDRLAGTVDEFAHENGKCRRQIRWNSGVGGACIFYFHTVDCVSYFCNVYAVYITICRSIGGLVFTI